jgi:hypothetical protein
MLTLCGRVSNVSNVIGRGIPLVVKIYFRGVAAHAFDVSRELRSCQNAFQGD